MTAEPLENVTVPADRIRPEIVPPLLTTPPLTYDPLETVSVPPASTVVPSAEPA